MHATTNPTQHITRKLASAYQQASYTTKWEGTE